MQLFRSAPDNYDGLELVVKELGNISYSLSGSSWWGSIRESFTGAWQRNIECETNANILRFSTVFTCVEIISDDIAKLRPKLMQQISAGLWSEITDGSPAFLPVLRKPNRYQTRIQFLSQWMTSKLLHGNTYVLLQRDGRKVVEAMYVLDPRLVTPKVASDGSVWYELRQDYLSRGDEEAVTVAASEIIHDRMMTLWHPLIGVTPIYACGSSATQGMRIQANSAKFFENMSRPSIHLAAPGVITDEQYKRLKERAEQAISGENIGRILVTSDGMKMDLMTIPAADAQLIEQQRWTGEDCARPFKMPLHKLGMGQQTVGNVAAMNQDYYSQCLQKHIEDIELLLDEALGLPALKYGTELDIDSLLRMDPVSRADRATKLIGAAIWSPNEGRLVENLPPVDGGASPMIQQQNFSLSALAKRDAKVDPFATSNPAPQAAPVAVPSQPSAKELADSLIAKFTTAAHVL